MNKIFYVVCASLLCGGCAFTAQSVKINPVVTSTSSVSGNGNKVQIAVVDERPSKVIGQRGVGSAGADMTVAGDLPTIISMAIVSGLEKHNFSTIAGEATDAIAKLKVEIRNLSSKNIMGFWAGTLRDEVSLKGICKSRTGDEYEKLYNGTFETSLQVVPTAEANDNYISNAVSQAVNELVNDDALLKCLAN